MKTSSVRLKTVLKQQTIAHFIETPTRINSLTKNYMTSKTKTSSDAFFHYFTLKITLNRPNIELNLLFILI